jgi:preprotein translocase subunit SecA
VTVATNTAGRGTDIILDPEAKANGGLHTMFTFYPTNSRVEDQGLGRSGRQGQKGTAQIVISDEDAEYVQLATK